MGWHSPAQTDEKAGVRESNAQKNVVACRRVFVAYEGHMRSCRQDAVVAPFARRGEHGTAHALPGLGLGGAQELLQSSELEADRLGRPAGVAVVSEAAGEVHVQDAR